MNAIQVEGQFLQMLEQIRHSIPTAGMVLGIFWGIFILNALLGHRLNYLGIYPRHLRGLIGIPFYPFLHGDFNHLFFNSIPLFVLMTFVLLAGIPAFLMISASIIVISGFLTWLLGRPGIHIGASSLILGYWGFLLFSAYEHPSILTIPVALICVYYFGSLALSLFPQEERISWEGHLFGLIAGILTYYLMYVSKIIA